MLRGMPLQLDVAIQAQAYTEHNEYFIFFFTMDRASANFSTLAYFFSKLAASDMPSPVLPWAEPCHAHGLQHVKSRARGGKDLIAKAQSLSSLMRTWKTLELLRTSLVNIVRENLIIDQFERPADVALSSRRCIDLLFGDEGRDNYMHSKTEAGKRPKPLLEDLRALIEGLDLGSGTPALLKHHCWVVVGSRLHLEEGLRPNRPCCKSREEAIERVVVPVLNLLVNRAWDRQAASRWTFVSKVSHRRTHGDLIRGVWY
jgi:hypothetical protein